MLKRHVYSSVEALFDFVAGELERYSEMPSPQHICLLGGSTAKGLFSYIVAKPYATRIKWRNLHFWWGDERCVAVNDPESNYGQAKQLLFDHIAIPAENIHPIIQAGNNAPGALSEDECSKALASFIAELNHMRDATSPIHDALAYPKFDWVLLGVGDDGHTASLFPEQFNAEEDASALLVCKPGTGQYRITLSARCISAARRVSYIATGIHKAKVLAEIFGHAESARQYPAALIRSAIGETDYYLDQDAAECLIK
jgi:6-phosphogluconolactonase